jgi:gliding motility-associated-like protein
MFSRYLTLGFILLALTFPSKARGQYSNIFISDQVVKYDDQKLSIVNLPSPINLSGYYRASAISDIHGNLSVYFDGINLRNQLGRIIGDSNQSAKYQLPKFLPFSPTKIGFLSITNDSISVKNGCESDYFSNCLYKLLEWKNNQWNITHQYFITDPNIKNWSNYDIVRFNDSTFQMCLIDPNYPKILLNVKIHSTQYALSSQTLLPFGLAFLDTIKNHPRISINYYNQITLNHTGDRCIVSSRGSAAFCPRLNDDPYPIIQKTEEIYSIAIDRTTGQLGIPLPISVTSKLFSDTDFNTSSEPFVFSPNGKVIYRIINNNAANKRSSCEQTNIATNNAKLIYSLPFRLPDIGLNALRILPDGRLLIQRDRRIKGRATCYFDMIKNPNNETNVQYNALYDSLNKVCFLNNSAINIYHYLRIKPTIKYRCGMAEITFNNLSDTSAGLNNFHYSIQKAQPDTTELFSFYGNNGSINTAQNGKYPFTVRGWSNTGYSEIWYDTFVIQVPKLDSFNAGDITSIKRATLLKNNQALVEWKPLSVAMSYDIYKNNRYFVSTTDTFFIDNLDMDVTAPIEYKIRCKDSCGYVGGFSNAGRTIFLSANENKTSTSQFSNAHVSFSKYQKWMDGVDYYELRGSHDGQNWASITSTIDTFYNDVDFISVNEYQKCYRVIAHGKNGLESSSNVSCLHYDPILFVPSAFTPDDNGLNDGFQVTAMGFAKFSLTIFNSWGQKIHTQTNSTDSWKPDEKVPAGVYVYQIRATNANGAEYSFNGTITMIR